MITSAIVIFHHKNGKVYEIPCHRHGDAFYIISQFLTTEEIDKEQTICGFLNEDGKFFDRIAAQKEAINCNQILKVEDLQGKELFSEDLW